MKGDTMQEYMKRAEALLLKCRRILKKENIPAADRITKLIINGRTRRRFGKCTREKNGYAIELSQHLLSADDTAVETVILHELLHTCPGCMNHGSKWKSYAERLNQKYGYHIKSVSTYDAFGLEDPGSRETVKYMVVCTECGAEYPRKRKCSLVENVDRYRCGKCGGKLEIY